MANIETIDDIRNMIKILGEKLEEIEKEVNKSEEQFPKNGDTYYFIGSEREFYRALWHNDDSDRGKLKIGNVFKTIEGAKFMIERLKVIKELKKFSRDFEPGKHNYFILFDYDEEDIVLDWDARVKPSTLFFDSSEMVEKAIETVGKERIKKYYFGIGEE